MPLQSSKIRCEYKTPFQNPVANENFIYVWSCLRAEGTVARWLSDLVTLALAINLSTKTVIHKNAD